VRESRLPQGWGLYRSALRYPQAVWLGGEIDPVESRESPRSGDSVVRPPRATLRATRRTTDFHALTHVLKPDEFAIAISFPQCFVLFGSQ